MLTAEEALSICFKNGLTVEERATFASFKEKVPVLCGNRAVYYAAFGGG